MEYNLGSNRASNFKSAERAARGRFEVTSTITPELYDICIVRHLYCNLLLFLFNLLLISSIFVPYVAVAGKPAYIFPLVLIG